MEPYCTFKKDGYIFEITKTPDGFVIGAYQGGVLVKESKMAMKDPVSDRVTERLAGRISRMRRSLVDI